MKTPIIAAAKNQASTNVALINPAINLNRELTELPEPDFHIAVVIPAYRVEGFITEVIGQVPRLVRTIIAVDDNSPDGTGKLLDQMARSERRLIVIHHDANRGVGGATKSGYLEALQRGADIVVKLDGDGQMKTEYIENLVAPIMAGQAEYAKGNRFQDWSYLQTMPLGRKSATQVCLFSLNWPRAIGTCLIHQRVYRGFSQDASAAQFRAPRRSISFRKQYAGRALQAGCPDQASTHGRGLQWRDEFS